MEGARFIEELEGVRDGKLLYLVLHQVYHSRRLFSQVQSQRWRGFACQGKESQSESSRI
jgi:hypothetical protein